MVKHFVVMYSSAGNTEVGKKVYIKANTLAETQDQFFEYLKKTPLYSHMWNLSMSVEEIEGAV